MLVIMPEAANTLEDVISNKKKTVEAGRKQSCGGERE